MGEKDLFKDMVKHKVPQVKHKMALSRMYTEREVSKQDECYL